MDEEQYCQDIFDRTLKLSNLSIIEPISIGQLTDWYSQFEKSEKILAALILDQLVVRSKRQVSALIDFLFLHSQSAGQESSMDDSAFIRSLTNKHKDIGIKLAPVLGENHPPTKSGPYILRLIQRKYAIADRHLTWPAKALELQQNELTKLILVDDFAGTGKQFCNFINDSGLSKLPTSHPKTKVFLLCLAAHKTAIEKIRTTYPWITVFHADYLGPEHHFLSGEYFQRISKSTGINLDQEKVRGLYDDVYSRAGCRAKNMKMGYGDLGLCYAFYHATPNNTIPLLWYQSSDWKPLIHR
tara:strand:+ start:4795 stop:5691 length:897 start_codon:yes stop_codon:yes gene_type:complete